MNNYVKIAKTFSIIIPIMFILSCFRYKDIGSFGFRAGGSLGGDAAIVWLIVLGIFSLVSPIVFLILRRKASKFKIGDYIDGESNSNNHQY